jgi:hypothetical protein
LGLIAGIPMIVEHSVFFSGSQPLAMVLGLALFIPTGAIGRTVTISGLHMTVSRPEVAKGVFLGLACRAKPGTAS